MSPTSTTVPEPGTIATAVYPGQTSKQAKRRASDDIAAAREQGWRFVNAVWRPADSRLARVLVGPLSRFAPRPGTLEVTYEYRPVPSPASAPVVTPSPPARSPVQRPSEPVSRGWRPPARRPVLPAPLWPSETPPVRPRWRPARAPRPTRSSSSATTRPATVPALFRVCALCEAFTGPSATRCPQCGHRILLDRVSPAGK